jgi:transposase
MSHLLRDLTDDQWALLNPLIPEPERRKDGRGRPWRDRREVLDGILFILRTGAAWADLPARYPPYQTCHRRFQQWIRCGIMRGVLEAVKRLIGDNAYDSDGLDRALAESGVEMIALHRANRKNRTQDGRALRRYRRQWKIERLFAWLQNYRRLTVRWERRLDNFLGMLHLACALILLRYL